jgi:hypothetical protein
VATTALFVELLVIGVGSAAWVTLGVLTVLGYSWIRLDLVTSLPALIPTIAILYVLGIITDRLADRLFQPVADHLRARAFRSREDYEKARDLVYSHSSLVGLIEYNRSRLRVCRGWIVNCAASILAFGGFVWAQAPPNWPQPKVLAVVFVVLTLVGLGAFQAWYQLTIDSFRRLSQQANLLREER